MSGITFKEDDDDFVVVDFKGKPADPAEDEGAAVPTRMRVRVDSATRRQRRQQAEIEKSSSTVVLVTNLRENCHEPFRERLLSEVAPANLSEIHLHKDHNFGFLVFANLEAMHDALQRLADVEINGGPISLSRCAAVTLWRNPRVDPDEQPCDVLALKNLPAELTMSALRRELRTMGVADPVEASFHVTPTGVFSGTVILRLPSVEAAQHAHALLNSLLLLERQVRAEYKRPNLRPAPRLYNPPCRESETLFARLKEFKSSTSDRLVLTTKLMSGAVREQLVLMVSFLGLRALSDGETPNAQLTVMRPLEERRPSRSSRSQTPLASDRASSVSRSPSIVASRMPRGPDGTRGFRPASAAPATPSARDSGLARDSARGPALPQGQETRSLSGTWRRGGGSGFPKRLTGTS